MSSKIKDILKQYQKAAKAAQTKVRHAGEVYTAEIATKEIEAIDKELGEERQQAIAEIEAVQAAAEKEIERWGRLDGSEITDDAKLLSFGIVTPDQFAVLVEKYKSNSTMSNILYEYGKNRNSKLVEGQGEYFDTSHIPTVEKRMREVQHVTTRAISIIEMIDNGFMGYGGGADSEMVNAAIENFV